jgi:hypothetical protein
MSQCHDVYDFERYETGKGRIVEGTQCHDVYDFERYETGKNRIIEETQRHHLEQTFGQSEAEPSQPRREDQERLVQPA